MGIGKSQRNVIEAASLKEFFRDSIGTALTNQQLDVDEHTSHYVVNLLTTFSRSERLYEKTPRGYGLKPLAFMLADAVEAATYTDRNRALQRLGDVSLFVAGFFHQSLSRKLVDVDYYVSMGGHAYGTLSDSIRGSVRGQAFGEIFEELAVKFQPLVDVLNEVSEMAYVHTDKDILRLYEVWIRTGSKRARRILRRLGVYPTEDAKSRRKH